MADLRVKDVMTNLVVSLRPDESVHEAAQRLSQNRISGAPVTENGKVVGMISEADLVHAVLPPVRVDRGLSVLDMLYVMGTAHPHGHSHGMTVGEVMSKLVVTIGPEESIWKAADRMERRGIKRLPVVDEDDYLIGLISRADVVKAVARSDADLEADVRDAIGVLGDEVITDLDVEVEDGVATISGLADRRSTHDLAIKLAGRTAGVLEVVDALDFAYADEVRPGPRPQDVLAPSTTLAS